MNSSESRYKCTSHFFTTQPKTVFLVFELKMNNGQKSM